MTTRGNYLPLQISDRDVSNRTQGFTRPYAKQVIVATALVLLLLFGLSRTSSRGIGSTRHPVSDENSYNSTTNDIAYVQSGHMHDWQAIALLYTRYSHPHATIHLLRHPFDGPAVDDIKVDWPSLFRAADVTVVWVEENTDSNRQLAHTYKHSSLNPVAYELFCFQRWATLYQYLTTQKIDSVLVLDADIFPMTNILTRFPYKDWLPEERGVYMQFWSRERMGAFVFYINSFYDRPARSVCADLDAIGGIYETPMWDDQWVKKQLVDCGDQRPKQVSDMFLFVEFQRVYSITPIIKYKPENRRLHAAVGQPHTMGDDVCVSLEKFRSHANWMTDEMQDRRMRIEATEDVLWALHMQGDCKEWTCAVFCPKLEPAHRKLMNCCRNVA
ncbi:BQ5605_C015g07798 [Microbotryum silenes-dioicae]|uniref:BQ5605_C015g07798 protein n=1 Tax=Microbotryum silenes-dioicae TaxID=796604 RepID=A0A2X0LWM2_9BASI|nr:BQ5605_C015g07798 [Microbotryum silenes-dioicae]